VWSAFGGSRKLAKISKVSKIAKWRGRLVRSLHHVEPLFSADCEDLRAVEITTLAGAR